MNELVDQRIPGYNFDMAEGVSYEIDLKKPFGQRIQNLKFHGQPLSPRQKLREVTNNYRVKGGGNAPHISAGYFLPFAAQLLINQPLMLAHCAKPRVQIR